MILCSNISEADIDHLDMVFSRFTEEGVWVVPEWVELLRKVSQSGGRLDTTEPQNNLGVDINV